jgi:hypothetical protein
MLFLKLDKRRKRVAEFFDLEGDSVWRKESASAAFSGGGSPHYRRGKCFSKPREAQGGQPKVNITKLPGPIELSTIDQ